VFVAHLRVGEKRAADYIEDHLDEEITLQWLADVAEVEPLPFYKGVQAAARRDPHRFNVSSLMERAKTLLDLAAAFGDGSWPVARFARQARSCRHTVA
jgi:hypothetical protein